MRTLAVLTLVTFPLAAFGQTTPAQAEKQMKLPPGFTARVVAHEPMVRQPVSMSSESYHDLFINSFLRYQSVLV